MCEQLRASRSRIIRPGYAIEYDYFDPTGLYHSLETKEVEGLFSRVKSMERPVEEAAAQGLLAGANAALKVQSKSLWEQVASKPTWGNGRRFDKFGHR